MQLQEFRSSESHIISRGPVANSGGICNAFLIVKASEAHATVPEGMRELSGMSPQGYLHQLYPRPVFRVVCGGLPSSNLHKSLGGELGTHMRK